MSNPDLLSILHTTNREPAHFIVVFLKDSGTMGVQHPIPGKRSAFGSVRPKHRDGTLASETIHSASTCGRQCVKPKIIGSVPIA